MIGRPAILEALSEVAALRDEDGNAVHHRAARVQDLLGVPLRRLLRADGEVVDDDVRARLLEDADDVVRVARGLLDDLGDVLAEPVVGHPARDGDPGLRDVRELDRVVRLGPDRVGEVLADLRLGDVERGRELDVADVVAAEVDVHQARNEIVRGCVLVVLDSLEERVGAVADADDCDANLVLASRLAVLTAVSGHRVLSWSWSAEALRERLDDDLVRAACGARARAFGELPLELWGDAQKDDARLARGGAAAAARGELDAELGGEDLDRDVVERALAPRHLAGEAPLQRRRHPDEDALQVSFRHSASSRTAASRLSARPELCAN